jgi:hypothetical protein
LKKLIRPFLGRPFLRRIEPTIIVNLVNAKPFFRHLAQNIELSPHNGHGTFLSGLVAQNGIEPVHPTLLLDRAADLLSVNPKETVEN